MKLKNSICWSVIMGLLMFSAPALAAEAQQIDTGDTAWVLMSAALVMIMVPAVGLFYSGMVRKKNAGSDLMEEVLQQQ